MRWLVLAAVAAGCGDVPSEHKSDAAADSAAPDGSPPMDCGAQLPFVASKPFDVVSDGTSLFISVMASDGTMQILTMPKTGGTPSVIATGTEQFVLAAHDNAVFFQTVNGTKHDLHAWVSGVDTVIASVPAGQLYLKANATDLYVLGPDNGGKTTLWRVPRTGAGNGPLPAVVSVTGAGSNLALGSTVAAFTVSTGNTSALELVDLPGPSVPSTNNMFSSSNYSFVGDQGFYLTAHMMTAQTTWIYINEFTPSDRTVYTTTTWMGMGWIGPIFTDEKYIYAAKDGGYMLLLPDGTIANAHVCTGGGLQGAQDASSLFGFTGAAPNWYVNVVPKPQ